MTAAHVVADGSKIQVVFADGISTGASIRRIDQYESNSLIILFQQAKFL
ncbi:hypothetical protein [Draconibacterium mangrovi]|nr:hypothetical protein [Draconibacterium mangrovi]